MRVVFRADASSRIGTGHVMRCLVLADALRARGAEVSFICRAHPGHLFATLQTRALPFLALSAPTATDVDAGEDYAAWLGVSEADDAAETLAAIGERSPDWVVVDHYGLGQEWETRVGSRAGRVLVIDDLANRPHACDLLLDQNFSEDGERRYAGLVPARCRQLVGPRFALLAPQYAARRATQVARREPVNRVLVYFGGVDPANMTGCALATLASPEFASLAVDLVIGANHAHRVALEAQAAARPGTRVHGLRPDLADLMADADIAIGAGGTTTWERMCLGLPSIVVSVAENQRPTCEALAEAALIIYLGGVDEADSARIGSAFEALLADPSLRAELRERGQATVDGGGAARVAEAMVAPVSEIVLKIRAALHSANAVPCGFDTFSFAWIDRCRAEEVLTVRNAPHVIEQMRTREAIGAADHRRFLEHYGAMDRYDFILIDDRTGRYVGAFYITNLSTAPEIGKYVGDRAYLGQGIARRAMQCLLDFCRCLTGLRRLSAFTRADNPRNLALNEALGFVRTGVEDGYVVMTLEL